MGKPAVMGGFWGSHMGLIDLLLERDGNKWKSACRRRRGAADLRARRTTRTSRPVERRPDDRRRGEGRPRGDAGLRPPAGRQDLGAALLLFRAGRRRSRRCRSSARRRPGTSSRLIKGDRSGRTLPILSAAAPFKAGGRNGPDYYTDVPAGDVAIKNVADLYLYPEHRPRGGDHRRAGEGMAGDVGRDLQPDRAGQGRPDADQRRLPELQFRRHRRRHLQDRPQPAAEIRPEGKL